MTALVRSRRTGFWLGLHVSRSSSWGTTLPTPLYPIYERQLGFTEVWVTVVFAASAVGVLGVLLFFGELSDRIGQRQVLPPGVVISALSAAIFIGLPSLPGSWRAGCSRACPPASSQAPPRRR